MDSVFPFGLPAPTAGYLSLYVATFALHQYFTHYVLAGTLYIGWAAVFPGTGTPRGERPLAAVIREWLPFLLSAAITAGVAPLLFVQIVYPLQFYTANLLLSRRWMIVVPVLIVAFYLLYLMKSKLFTQWSLAARTFVTLATSACFVFVGFCWTTNRLLGNDEANWPDVYTSGVLNLDVGQVISRMFIWLGGSFASLAVFTGWQLRRHDGLPDGDVVNIAVMGIAGVLVSFCSALTYMSIVGREFRESLLSPAVMPYVLITVAGICSQLLGWWKTKELRAITTRTLIWASIGLFFCLVGCSVMREVVRVRDLDLTALYARHAEASQVGGLSVFVLFSLVNAGLIGFCIWLVRSNGRKLT